MQGGKTSDEDESDELKKFRKQWLDEVRHKRKGEDKSVQPEKQAAPQADAAPARRRSVERPALFGAPPSPSSSAVKREGASFGPTLQRAVEIYQRAVEHEQRSELDIAVDLYRSAFRIDSNVHRAYQLVENEQKRKVAVATHHRKTSSTSHEIDGLVRGMGSLDIGAGPVSRGVVVTGSLAKLVASWPIDLTFNPPQLEGEGDEQTEGKDEEDRVSLKNLSDELLLMVLKLLDHTALERFARVSRKARVITLEGSLWRPMVKAIYQPPQLTEEEDYDALVVKYMSDYRRIYVEHPRVRYDGVYIALCHYVRHGLGENAWVNYSRTVTYYRYLRFYPDGEVLSLLANEDHAPAQIVPTLKPSLRMKGFSIGTWYLDGTTVHVGNLLEPGTMEARYSFQMVLDLRSRPLGRWNRLDFRTYDSVHLGSGEAVPLPLKHERSFWFSKVRSYGA